MLDEEMDHIIRDAAENHHPAYNDKAWEKMEKMLDNHLPQRKDRRRPVFFVLLSLLLGTAVLFTVLNWNNHKTVNTSGNDTGAAGERSTLQQLPPEENNNTGSVITAPATAPVNADTDNAAGQAGIIAAAPGERDANDASGEYLANRNYLRQHENGRTAIKIIPPGMEQDADNAAAVGLRKHDHHTSKVNGRQKTAIINAVAETDDMNTDNTLPDTKNTTASKANRGEATASPEDKHLLAETRQTADNKKEDIKKQNTKKPQEKTTAAADKMKNKQKFGSNFGITASIGPDVSFVKLDNTGKTTLTYGAGLSYDFAKRFTARAGFYVSKKVYEATPDQYHTPGGNYPHLTGVDANCKVYEIPVSVTYNFGQRKKHNWLASAGLSSFIMKTEDYVYNYKNPAGQTYAYYQEIKNENNHYFAVLNISCGYKYQLSKKVAVQAEPYVKIPLAGVGHGKIKLNSAGALLTVTVKPFKKKK